ncbi:LysR family transcriptional regulator [Anaerolentibacter hominis]|uniref:LysR family transcriptional regulator n=1 Tax=Anaerolentibacter hominis TaxID=3079009 RepID=UPI0031B88567
MTIRHLRIFVAVYENSSITKASQLLHLAQPSVSLAVKELEDYYGVKLFDRISRRLYVTESGIHFYGYASHIISLFDEMEKSIRNWDMLGTLRIGASITIGNFYLPDLVRQFRTAYPQIRVQASVYNSEQAEESVLNNQVDFALIEGIPRHPHVKQIPFLDDKLVLISSPDHPIQKEAPVEFSRITAYDFILREKGSSGREILDSTLVLHHMDIEPVWESVSTQAIVKAVEAGLGLSVLPYLLVKKDLEEGTICTVPLRDVSFDRKFYIIFHEHKYLTDSAEAFIQMCLKLGQNPAASFSSDLGRL